MERFSVGDLAVYQDQGVGQITDVGSLEVAGSSLEVYTLRMTSGAIVRVPTHKAKAVGLRGLIPETQVGQVFDILRSKAEKPREKTWNRRYRVYTERLRTGELGADQRQLASARLISSLVVEALMRAMARRAH